MKKRVISAVIALLICIPLICVGGIPFYILAILISLLGLREILNLSIEGNLTKILAYLSYISIISSNLFKTNFSDILNHNIIGIIFLIFCLVILLNYKNKEFDITKGFSLIGIVLFLSVSFSTMIINRNLGLNYFLYLLTIPFLNDTFAYIIGSKIGKHKLTEISPKKSIEGCVFGLLFGTIISTIIYISFINSSVNVFKLIGINIFLSILGQLGDLFFSLIKRNYKIKDFSNLMPGHGGVLDRLDSVIFVMLASIFISLI